MPGHHACHQFFVHCFLLRVPRRLRRCARRSRCLPRLLRMGFGSPVRVRDRSCRVPLFRRSWAFVGRFPLSFVLSFFGPSLGPPFCSCRPQTLLRPLLTPRRLSAPGSPQVDGQSFRSRLWALQNVVSDSWASRFLAHSPPTSCLTAHLCSFGRAFASRGVEPSGGDDVAVGTRRQGLDERFI